MTDTRWHAFTSLTIHFDGEFWRLYDRIHRLRCESVLFADMERMALEVIAEWMAVEESTKPKSLSLEDLGL